MAVISMVARTKHLLPDLDELEKLLKDSPEDVISQAFPRSESELRARSIMWPELESVEFNELDNAIQQERRSIIAAAARALERIRIHGDDAELKPDEAFGYEAIISITGRPAILIQNGEFFPPPSGWEILDEVRDSIQETCLSVGRIEISGDPNLDWIGTGFLVADDVVMTNWHVARKFCKWGQLEFKPGIKPRIDYVEELGAIKSAEFDIKKVIDFNEELDYALLRVSKVSPSEAKPPKPLIIASEVPTEMKDRIVYVIGYPAWDPRMPNPEIMRRIFSNIYGVKRLQPGKVMEVFKRHSLFYHDCSTLGGNSGSCVVDLETNQVIGLHFSGRYQVANQAVALWTLTDDPKLKNAGINFD